MRKAGSHFSYFPNQNFENEKYISSVYKTINVILKYKPNLIIGFGGYTSIFPIILGRILGTKTLIHEQNAIIGKANKLLSSLGTEVALTFKKTAKKWFPFF